MSTVACFFCKSHSSMELHDTQHARILRCPTCGESVSASKMDGTLVEPGFGPTCWLAPGVQYWTEEIAQKWKDFELYKVSGFRAIGYYTDHEADARSKNICEEVSKWRERKKNGGILGFIRKRLARLTCKLRGHIEELVWEPGGVGIMKQSRRCKRCRYWLHEYGDEAPQ